VFVGEGIGALAARLGRQAVAQLPQHVIQVESAHLLKIAHQQGRPPTIGQVTQ